MPEFSKDRAAAGIWELELTPDTRRLANYWLSLWEGDDLPWRHHYDPAAVRDLLPGIAILEVKPGEYVHVRLAGSAVNAAVGFDLSGKDISTITHESDRPVRLARNSQIAFGAAAWALRGGRTSDGRDWRSEEVHLPFRDVLENGARLVLFHTTWRPDESGKPIVEAATGLQLVETWKVVHFRVRGED